MDLFQFFLLMAKKKLQNSVHVVVEWPLIWTSFAHFYHLAQIREIDDNLDYKIFKLTPTNVQTYLPIYRTKNHLGDWQIYAFTHSALLHGFIGRAVCLVVRIICTYIYLSILFYYLCTQYCIHNRAVGPEGTPLPQNFWYIMPYSYSLPPPSGPLSPHWNFQTFLRLCKKWRRPTHTRKLRHNQNCRVTQDMIYQGKSFRCVEFSSMENIWVLNYFNSAISFLFWDNVLIPFKTSFFFLQRVLLLSGIHHFCIIKLRRMHFSIISF